LIFSGVRQWQWKNGGIPRSTFEFELGRDYCTDLRNTKQTGFPSIGHRCRWFHDTNED